MLAQVFHVLQKIDVNLGFPCDACNTQKIYERKNTETFNFM